MLVYLVSAYGESKLDKRGTVWVDHTPDNFDHALALTRHFPDCKFIHMVRDGRAVAASVLPLPWGPCTAEDAAGWWVRRIAVGLAAEQHFGERGQILRVYYHDLVQRPVETINRILDFLELPREEVLLSDRASFLLPEFTKPQHTLVHQAPDVGRVDAWRKVLTHRQIEFFELTAGVLLTYLGFELESRYPIRPQTNLEALRSKVKKISRKVSDRRELARQMSMEQG
jgi:hypothetical protein